MHPLMRTYGVTFIKQSIIKEQLEETKHVVVFPIELQHTLPSKFTNTSTLQNIAM